jgi:hypothetical protein
MNFFNFFKRKPASLVSNSQKPMDTNSLFFHEDDFCQIELIPSSNRDDLTIEIEKIKEFSDKHSDGFGYTDIYVRKENNVPLREKKINTSDLIEIFDNLDVRKYSEVYTGYGTSYRVISEDTIGYGTGYSAIYFDFKQDVVQNIWITNPWGLDKQNLATILLNIGLKWNLVLMDWNLDRVIDLCDIAAVKKYLRMNK